MAFNPSSTIFLCNVPFDNTYKHQVYFATQNEQYNYFVNCGRDVVENYLTVRKTLPDGSVQSSVKVNRNIDQLYQCNYMFYQNANHGTKYFYAFITNLIYINENTTEIIFETDVYQTWLFDAIIKPSFVVREHAMDDTVGANIIPEKFNYSEFDYHTVMNDSTLQEWGYLIAASSPESKSIEAVRGYEMSGIYQGLYFYYFEDAMLMNVFLNALEKEQGDCVVLITAIPKFCAGADTQNSTQIGASDKPSEATVEVNMNPTYYTFGGYKPNNNKLYTYPFYKLAVTNHSGQEAEYVCEYFKNRKLATFTMYGDISANPSVTLIPNDYKGVTENPDFGITLGGFPQCAFNSDSYKLWLARNQNSLLLNVGMGLGQATVGAVMTYGTGGLGGVAGAGMMASGIHGILSNIATGMDMKKEPNKYSAGAPKNNLLTAMKKNKFDYYILTLKREYAEIIDEFFTMYGYQTNRVKIPNMSGRPCWNYVHTVDINIDTYNDGAFVGGIPCDDMRKLKAMYNNGVTLWKPTTPMYDYSKDNHIHSLN